MDYASHLQNVNHKLEQHIHRMKDIERDLREWSKNKYERQMSTGKPDEENVFDQTKHHRIKENYQKVVTNWEQLYGDVEGSPKLLREDKRKTVIKFTNDPMNLNQHLSDSDVLSQGLYNFTFEYENIDETNPSDVEGIFKSLQLSPMQIISLEQWMKKHVENVKISTKHCEMLRAQMKQLLVEKKQLKEEEKSLQLIVKDLKEQIKQHPTEKQEEEIVIEINSLRERIEDIADKECKAIRMKQSLFKALREETKCKISLVHKMNEEIKELKENNAHLKQFAEVTVQRTSSLLKRKLTGLSRSVKKILRLKELLDKVRQVLEEESCYMHRLDMESNTKYDLLEKLKARLFTSQSVTHDMQSKVEKLSGSSLQLITSIDEMQEEMKKIANAFTDASEHLTKAMNSLGQRTEKELEVERVIERLLNQSKEIQEVKKRIEDVKREMRKLRMPEKKRKKKLNIDVSDEDRKKELLIWNDKVMSLLSTAEELDELAEEAKVEQEKEKNNELKVRKSKFAPGDVEANKERRVEASYALSTSFTSTNISKGYQYTISGKDSIIKDLCKK